MKAEVGNVFYRVQYQGLLTKLEIIEFKNDNPVYALTSLVTIKDDVWKFREDPKRHGTSNYPISIMQEKPLEYFTVYEDAVQKSLDRFEKEVNPNGNYRVARYFDDMFEAYVTGVLTKKEAKIQVEMFNTSTPRHYVQYRIRVTNE